MWQGAPYLPERSRVSPRKLYKKKRTMPSKRGRSLFDVQKEENKKKVQGRRHGTPVSVPQTKLTINGKV